jgi:hypothetical protein
MNKKYTQLIQIDIFILQQADLAAKQIYFGGGYLLLH